MPKILIKETDNTSAGTPGSYANYSVLIAGYKGEPTQGGKKIVEPDSNGVYEFSSKQEFLDTIGLSAIEKPSAKTGIVETSYGNQMAAELLGLGYQVIYKPIDSVLEMNDESFWEIFRDKASYDFRFVSHGLLETNCDEDTYKALSDSLTALEADQAKLTELKENVDKTEGLDENARKEAYANAYITLITPESAGGEGYTGFKKPASKKGDERYGSYDEAVTGTASELAKVNAHKDEHDKTCVTPSVFNSINTHIVTIARYVEGSAETVPGRGDCVALIELDEKTYVGKTGRPEANIIVGIEGMGNIAADGTYAAMTVPSVYYNMSGSIKKFPGAFHYLACFMNSLKAGFAEWYAAAGYTRGTSSYVVDHTSVKLGEIAINALEPRNKADGVKLPFACNVIANFRGSYYLWGNRTAAALGEAKGGADLTAKHFLNIRQLSSTLKKQIYVACRRFTFDPNSDTLWFNFVNAIAPTLDVMKADQGIRDYKIIKEFTDKKATLKAKVRIIPIEAVEDFDIEVSLEDSFDGVAVTTK